MPGIPKALPSTTFAVLRPTPGKRDEVLEPPRHLAAEPLAEGLAKTDQLVVLARKKPVDG